MDFIPVNEPLLDGNEKKYLNECIDTGWISSEGPFVKKFEDSPRWLDHFRYFYDRKEYIVCNPADSSSCPVHGINKS